MAQLIARIPITIANGDYISGVANLSGRTPTVIEMPSAWTAAVLTFAGSCDDTNYHPVCEDDGTEVTLTVDANFRVVLTGYTEKAFSNHKTIKLRSGTYAAHVAQGVERVIYIELWE
jgi:hypothetical protein